MNPLFLLVSLFHMAVWLFILFAFLTKKTAYFNIFYLIPFIYVLHVLPFHILCKMEESMYPDDYKERFDRVGGYIGVIPLYKKLEKLCENTTYSPISPQGMLIFGAITSAYALCYHTDIITNILAFFKR